MASVIITAEQFGDIQELDASEEDGGSAQNDTVTTIGDNDLNDLFHMDDQKGTVLDIEEPFINQLIDNPDMDSDVTMNRWQFHLSNNVSDVSVTNQSEGSHNEMVQIHSITCHAPLNSIKCDLCTEV